MELDIDFLRSIYVSKEQLENGTAYNTGSYIFEGIEDSALKRIISTSRLEDYQAGETIIKEDMQPNGEAFIILDGEVEVTIGGIQVAILKKGNIFGEYALICEDNRSATVRARSAIRCMIITNDCLQRLINEDNLINNILMDRIANNYEINLKR